MSELNKPIANPTVVLREEFDDWAVLFDPDTGDAFGLDPVSVLTWKLLDGKHSSKDIVGQLKENCKDVPDEAESHINEFVDSLLEKGLAGYEEK